MRQRLLSFVVLGLVVGCVGDRMNSTYPLATRADELASRQCAGHADGRACARDARCQWAMQAFGQEFCKGAKCPPPPPATAFCTVNGTMPGCDAFKEAGGCSRNNCVWEPLTRQRPNPFAGFCRSPAPIGFDCYAYTSDPVQCKQHNCRFTLDCDGVPGLSCRSNCEGDGGEPPRPGRTDDR